MSIRSSYYGTRDRIIYQSDGEIDYILRNYNAAITLIDTRHKECIMSYVTEVEIKFHDSDPNRFFNDICKARRAEIESHREETVRKQHPALQNAYEQYKILLNLYDDNK